MFNEIAILNRIARELLGADLVDLPIPTQTALLLAMRAGQKTALASTALALAKKARG